MRYGCKQMSKAKKILGEMGKKGPKYSYDRSGNEYEVGTMPPGHPTNAKLSRKKRNKIMQQILDIYSSFEQKDLAEMMLDQIADDLQSMPDDQLLRELESMDGGE